MQRHVRVTTTASGVRAVQVVEYVRRIMRVCKHIGSAHTEKDLKELKRVAEAWILKNPPQERLFAVETNASRTLREYEYHGALFLYAYELLHRLCTHFGFNFSFVLYDVTTLYFETFKSDSLRKPGFSKDNKPQQPQIVIGLMVTPEGFPVSYEVFAGNTFEGATFLPSILAFKSLHKIEKLTIVADAAMLSLDNIEKLVEHNLTYIVGARLRNISSYLLEIIDATLPRTDGASKKTTTPHGELIYAFSRKRHIKDLSDMNKQIKKGHPNPSI